MKHFLHEALVTLAYAGVLCLLVAGFAVFLELTLR